MNFACGVMVPTRATVSPWTALPAAGPSHGGLLHSHQVVKSKHLLVELIETSDQPLTVNINWEDVVVIRPSSHRILQDSVCPSPVDLGNRVV